MMIISNNVKFLSKKLNMQIICGLVYSNVYFPNPASSSVAVGHCIWFLVDFAFSVKGVYELDNTVRHHLLVIDTLTWWWAWFDE